MHTRRRQRRLVAHGAALLILGMLCGAAYGFALLGQPLPGSERGWRVAHLGNLLNGVMLVAIAAALGTVALGERAERWVYGALVITGWGNAVFYLFANVAPNRGLSLGANRFGEGDAFGVIAYVPAMVAAVAVLVALVLLLRAALRASGAEGGDGA